MKLLLGKRRLKNAELTKGQRCHLLHSVNVVLFPLPLSTVSKVQGVSLMSSKNRGRLFDISQRLGEV